MPKSASKTIYINARFLSQRVTGVQRYAIELVKGLDALIDAGKIDTSEFNFIQLSPQNIQFNLDLKHIKHYRVGYLSGHAWEQFELPFYARDGFLICLGNTAPILKRNQLVTIHDVSVFAIPEAYSLIFRSWYRFLMMASRFQAFHLLTVSKFSKQEIERTLSIVPSRVDYIYEGKEHVFSAPANTTIINDNNLEDKRFVLMVGSMSPHKNFSTAIAAISDLIKLDILVIIVGSESTKVFMQNEILDSVKVKHLGYVNDAELRSLYEHAYCLIHPSFYEGFGLPPLEAMACGCPVVASRAAAIPEVCGDAALYFDPHNPQELASQVSRLVKDRDLHQSMKQKSRIRSDFFSWMKCANETYQLIKKLNTIQT